MAETLLTGQLVHLFGRVMDDISINHEAYGLGSPEQLGDNYFLQKQLNRQGEGVKDAKLARIYAFAYGGLVQNFRAPAIFLVHGNGEPADGVKPPDRQSRSPGPIDDIGAATRWRQFADDVQYWTYDKDDVLLRLDQMSGRVEDIVLEFESRGMDMAGQASGMWARSSGMWARSSGMWARSSGMWARNPGDTD